MGRLRIWHLLGKGALVGEKGPTLSLIFLHLPQAPNASVLVFFHNTLEGRGSEGPLAIDGSYLAAIGNLIVVTAGYRVGIFGFLSSGESLA